MPLLAFLTLEAVFWSLVSGRKSGRLLRTEVVDGEGEVREVSVWPEDDEDPEGALLEAERAAFAAANGIELQSTWSSTSPPSSTQRDSVVKENNGESADHFSGGNVGGPEGGQEDDSGAIQDKLQERMSRGMTDQRRVEAVSRPEVARDDRSAEERDAVVRLEQSTDPQVVVPKDDNEHRYIEEAIGIEKSVDVVSGKHDKEHRKAGSQVVTDDRIDDIFDGAAVARQEAGRVISSSSYKSQERQQDYLVREQSIRPVVTPSSPTTSESSSIPTSTNLYDDHIHIVSETVESESFLLSQSTWLQWVGFGFSATGGAFGFAAALLLAVAVGGMYCLRVLFPHVRSAAGNKSSKGAAASECDEKKHARSGEGKMSSFSSGSKDMASKSGVKAERASGGSNDHCSDRSGAGLITADTSTSTADISSILATSTSCIEEPYDMAFSGLNSHLLSLDDIEDTEEDISKELDCMAEKK
ncbi:unnamed protein product [Amoebophrya sp. A25]|nr:unnamed protein product [Amoebophrya sp. A25]|eukprot:GSA25T00015623001.1